jgi:anti-sigma regulatory factor (Ser/Thr protein kinase)
MPFQALKYFDKMASEHCASFYYRGPFLERFTKTFLDISQGTGSNTSQDNSLGKKMSFVIVECFQNILKHAENREKIGHLLKDEGMFSFKNVDGNFVLNSINVINNPEVDKIISLVEKVNSLTDIDLKQYYLENLKNNTLSDRGGAGLGLIEMARKSGQKILYRIDDLNNNYSYFHQQITLQKNGEPGDHSIQLENSGDSYKMMTIDDVVLMCKGEFNQRSILPLLELAEHNARDKSMDQRKTLRAAHVTVEMLQNISKHAKKAHNIESQYGIFMLGQKNNKLILTAGNIVNISEKMLLEEKLDYLLSLDEYELKELHKSTLRATLHFENKSNAGLGLIEVAQASGNSMQYEFIPSSRENYLFAIQVSI